MRAIAVREPGASQISEGLKTIEYRSRRIALGPLVILSNGSTLAIVDVMRVTKARGGFAWHLANVRRLQRVAARSYGWITHVDDARLRIEHNDPITCSPRIPKKKRAPYRVDGETVRRSWRDAHTRALQLARERGQLVSVYKPDPFGFGDVIAFKLSPLA